MRVLAKGVVVSLIAFCVPLSVWADCETSLKTPFAFDWAHLVGAYAKAEETFQKKNLFEFTERLQVELPLLLAEAHGEGKTEVELLMSPDDFYCTRHNLERDVRLPQQMWSKDRILRWIPVIGHEISPFAKQVLSFCHDESYSCEISEIVISQGTVKALRSANEVRTQLGDWEVQQGRGLSGDRAYRLVIKQKSIVSLRSSNQSNCESEFL